MNLRSAKFLFIDCQTTGMRPSVGSLLEFAYGWASSVDDQIEISSSLVELKPGDSIQPRVREITGITNGDLVSAVAVTDVRSAFEASIQGARAQTPASEPAHEVDTPAVALIHYAQFEEAWLRDLLQTENLPFQLLCTHRLSKKLFPAVPSRNIRALSGFFGVRIGEVRRAAQHVRATHKIWQALVPALEEAGVHTVSEAQAFLAAKAPKPRPSESSAAKSKRAPAYEYRVDREKRLALPAKPGIYKMIAKSGEILYVGKATSLKDRVNSYFRGKKGRDPRKLEMMAQVWDLEVVECGSAIEAALIESDEIKRLNPPYNVSLKEGNRALLYYDRELEHESLVHSADHPVGPFRRFNAVEQMRLFADGLRVDLIRNVFYEDLEPALLEQAFELFEKKYPWFQPASFTTRDHLAFGLSLLRHRVQESAPDVEDVAEGVAEDVKEIDAVIEAKAEEATELSAHELLEKIERLYLRAARSYLRAKELTRLLWSDVSWTERGEKKCLSVRGGRLSSCDSSDLAKRESVATPWAGLAISDYDRMSVLLMEISKLDHEISAIGRQ